MTLSELKSSLGLTPTRLETGFYSENCLHTVGHQFKGEPDDYDTRLRLTAENLGLSTEDLSHLNPKYSKKGKESGKKGGERGGGSNRK